MSEPFPDLVRSRAVVLRLENVDTDVITPIARVLQGREAVVRYAFEPLRFDADGSPLASDPFADAARHDAAILIAGRNFGCGSSRETAAWAVRGMGFRAVIAPSFGDIFYSNCLKNGVVAIRLPAEDVAALARAADAAAAIEVDLRAQVVRGGAEDLAFEIGPLHKEMLLLGLDEVGLIQARKDSQRVFATHDSALRPWVRSRIANA